METQGTESNGSLKDVAEQAAEARANEITEEKRRFERVLPVPLTDEQVAERARLMAEIDRKIQDLEDEKKELAASLGSRIKRLQGDLHDVAKEVRSGAVEHGVQCVEGLDHSEQHMLTVRLDTGEVIERRPLTPAERQGNFAFDDDGDEDAELDAAAQALRDTYSREEMDAMAERAGVEVEESMSDYAVSDLLAEAGVRAEDEESEGDEEPR